MPPSYDFTLNATEICLAILRKIGNTDPDPGQIADARQVLNVILKELEADNINLVASEKVALPLTASTASYTLDSKYVGITQATISISNQDIALEIVPRLIYEQIPAKTAAGNPQLIMLNFSDAKIYFYPVPTTSMTANITFMRLVADFDTGSDIPQLPVKWTMFMIYAGAAYLADDYGIAQGTKDRLKIEAERLKLRAMASNSGRTGMLQIQSSVPVI